MNSHIQVDFGDVSTEQQEILIARLAEVGYEGFEQIDRTLKAFIPSDKFDETNLKDIAAKSGLSFNRSVVEETNWNAVWESSFQPVIVDGWTAIRADFHEPVAGIEQEIIITPKMSFGTGHHATTYLMIQQMRTIDFTGKKVFDFGTGTGVLAILAEKLGAGTVIAVDNDEWSIANAVENLDRNHCRKVACRNADTIIRDGQYDIILANINKNVILENFSSLSGQLSPNGILLLSGLLEGDEDDIKAEAGKYPLIFSAKATRDKWIALRFTR